MKKGETSKQIFAKICLLRFLNSFLKGNKGVRMDQRFHHQESTVSCSQINKGWQGHRVQLHGVVYE
jgi:hypothetical protein